MSSKHKLVYPFVALTGVIIFGTFGYMMVEKWNFFDAIYMTIITLTTVGYEEVHRLTSEGRVFSMVLMLTGVGTMFYAFGVGAKVLLEGELRIKC